MREGNPTPDPTSDEPFSNYKFQHFQYLRLLEEYAEKVRIWINIEGDFLNMICPKCGNECWDESNFCRKCGADLRNQINLTENSKQPKENGNMQIHNTLPKNEKQNMACMKTTKSRTIIILTILLVISLIGNTILLSGCVSKFDYEALEQRVEALENLLNSGNETGASADSQQNNSSTMQEESTHSDETPHQDSVKYSIEDMTAQEILDECIYYFGNLPYKGETYSDYKKTLKVVPVDNGYSDSTGYYYYDNSDYNYSPSEDCITSINVYGTNTQMDGTIGYSDSMNPVITVGISLLIHDYDKAAEVYQLLFEYISNQCNYISEDSRESTTWYAIGWVQYDDRSTTNFEFLNMTKAEGYYTITAYSRSKIDQ